MTVGRRKQVAASRGMASQPHASAKQREGRQRRRTVIFLAASVWLVVSSVFMFAGPLTASAAGPTISTVAGTGSSGFNGNGGSATSAQLNTPTDAVRDAAGNLYIADLGNSMVRKVNTSGVITAFAGTGTAGFAGDGGPATAAELDQPFGLLLDSAGNLYVADQGASENRIRKIDTSGVITTFAGNGSLSASPDGTPAVSAAIGQPQYMAIAPAGFFFSDDVNSKVWKINSSGILTTVASGIPSALGLAADPAGNLYVAAFSGSVVDKIDTSGHVTVVAGNGSGGYSGDGGPATSATLNRPYGVAFFGGSLYISEYGNRVVRKVDTSGTITTVVGNGSCCYSGDGGPATSAALNAPSGLHFDGGGDLFISDFQNNTVREVALLAPNDLLSLSGAAPAIVATGQGYAYTLAVTDPGGVGSASGVTLSDTLPAGVAFVSATTTQGTCTASGSAVTCAIGAMAVGATVTVTINVTAPSAGASLTNSASVSANQTDPFTLDNTVSETTIASPDADLSVTASASPNPAVAGRVVRFGMVVHNAGPAVATNVVLANSLTAGVPIQSTSASQGSCTTATAAVNCSLGTLASGASATVSIAVLLTGSVSPATNTATVSADQADPNSADNTASVQVPLVAVGSALSAFAGTQGEIGYIGDGGPATAARLANPVGIVGDSAGNIYIADQSNNVIRKVDPSGVISTFAGTGAAGYSGDGGPAASAQLNQPTWVALDSAGDLLVADSSNNVIRSISPSGTITTVAGNGKPGYAGDGGPAKSAELSGPQTVTALPSGGLLISDTNNSVVRQVDASGRITTFAGNGAAGLSGNGGPATAAALNSPQATAVDANGDILIDDCGSNEIRKVDHTGTITAFAGNGIGGFFGDGGPATLAEMNCPEGLAVDGDFVFFTDTNNQRVRQIDPFGTITTIAGGASSNNGNNFSCQNDPPLQAAVPSPAGLFMDSSATLYIAETSTSFVCDIQFGPDLLKVTESAPKAVAFGQTYAYNVTVTNVGGAGTATGVTLSDPLPSSLTFVSGSTSAGSCAFSAGTVSCPLGQMPPGTEATAAISVTAPTTSAGPLSNTVSVSANESDPAPQDNTATVVTLIDGADVGVTATQLPNPARVGSAMTYTLSVTDAGPGDATGVSLTDALPQGVAFKSASASQGTCGPAGATVTCALGTVPVGASPTVTVVVTPSVQTPSPLTNTATVGATQPDPNATNNTATVQANLVGVPGTINTIAGSGGCDLGAIGGQAAIAVSICNPYGVVGDSAGNTYVSEGVNGRNAILKIDPNGIITTYAGADPGGFGGDGGPATAAQLNGPSMLAFDAAGNLLVVDNVNNRVRSISPSGIITTVAGNGTAGYSGDGGAATSAELNNPTGVAGLPGGGFLITDVSNNVIRRVDASGKITTYAGDGTAGYTGDGGPATSAQLNFPLSVAVDPAGNVFIADFSNNAIRKVDPSGTITTFAGNGTYGGFGGQGDGGPATSAALTNPHGIALAAGSVYIADYNGFDIRRVDPNGIITTVAGGACCSFGDGGPATQALINRPKQLFFDAEGNLDEVDSGSDTVRQIADLAPNLLHLTGVAPTFLNASQQFSYTFQVSNPGSIGGATGVTLSDPLPSGLEYVSSSASQGSCGLAGATVTCALGALPASSSATVTITVTGPASAADITNTATVTANESDPQTSDNSVSVVSHVGKVDLSISQSASQPAVRLNQQLTFSMSVASKGSATGVLMTDALPTALQFVSATPSQGKCSTASGTVMCALGAIADGGAAQVSVTATAVKAGSVTNTAAVVADQPDVNLANNSASATSYVNPSSCGEVITTNTKLTADVGPCYGDGVIIGADGIALDLNGHSILGLGRRLDDMAGIRLPFRSHVMIENGTVTGFAEGIFVNSGGGNTITNMNIHDNIGPAAIGGIGAGAIDPDFGDGIFLQHSAANQILNSTITHNGIFDGIGIFGLDSNFNLVQGNTISKNVHEGRGQDGEGIALNAFLELGDPRRGTSLYGNSFIGNTIVDNQASGISSISNVNGQYLNNDIERNGLDTGTFPNNGVGLQHDSAATPNTDDLVQGNKVVGNGVDGIEADFTNGSHILNNTTNGNNVNGHVNGGFGRGFDLSDFSGNCSANVWKGNTYGSGGVNPACLASTNTGPSATASSAAPATSSTARPRHQVGPTFTGSPAASSGPVAAPAATAGTPSPTPVCGAMITASITLTANIGPCPGSGLVIGADNITVNLGGHSITGTGTGDGTRAGVMIFGHQGVTVTNGSISNFDAGVAVNLGANNTISKLNIHDNVGPGTTVALSDGIAIFHSFGTQVLNNTLTHDGTHSGIGVYGLDSNATVIKNNVVKATAGTRSSGILVTALLEPNDDRRGLPIEGNTIFGNTVSGNQAAGIVSVTNINALIQSNQVANNGVGAGSTRDGIQLNYDVAGGASPRTADSVLGNVVSGNGDNGIAVYSRGNTIQGNSATGDNVNADGSFDLFDNNPGCDHNTWQGNTSGSAGFSPSCT